VDKEVESYNLTLKRIGSGGDPADDGVTFLVNVSTGRRYLGPVPGKPDFHRLPKGNYAAVTWFFGAEPDAPKTMLVDPAIGLTRDTTVTLDARAAKRVKVTVPHADAKSALAFVETQVAPDAGGSLGFGFLDATWDNTFIGQRDPASRSDRVNSTITSHWVKGGGTVEGSPYAYRLMWAADGHLPTGFTRTPAAGDLATVTAEYASQGVASGFASAYGAFDRIGGGFSALLPVTLPGRRTEYYSTEGGVTWRRELLEGDSEVVSIAVSPASRFEPGRSYTDRRNAAAFGPGFDETDLDLFRVGDQMLVAPRQHSPAGWAGFSPFGTGRTVVMRDGTVLIDEPATAAFLPVPPAEGAYKVTVEANRAAPSTLSTKVSATWTFRSATVPGEVPAGLPVSAVRFEPPLNDMNTAPANVGFAIPVRIQRQPKSSAGAARTLGVEVSYDDGVTWQRAVVIRGGQSGIAIVRHPAGAGFVSLRATSTDSAGNTLEQTVIRAYRIA
jgi:hypothetical protein